MAIKPNGLSTNDGLSYYGTFLETIIPYSLALAGASLLGYLSTERFINNPGLSYIKTSMLAICLLTIGVILTPYTLNITFSDLHELFGALTFILQGILTVRIVFFVRRDRLNFSLLLLELVGGLMSAYYLQPKEGFLIQGQMLFQLAFGLIMIRNAAGLSNETDSLVPATSRQQQNRSNPLE